MLFHTDVDERPGKASDGGCYNVSRLNAVNDRRDYLRYDPPGAPDRHCRNRQHNPSNFSIAYGSHNLPHFSPIHRYQEYLLDTKLYQDMCQNESGNILRIPP